MTQGKWLRLSSTQKTDIWTRWKAGQTLHEIGRAYGKPHPTIRKVLLSRGGIAPTARRRSRLALTLAEREDISRGIASDSSLREIARRLDRAASTVSREICRHGGRPAYRAHDADDHAWDSALPNLLLRQYFPRGTDLSVHSQVQLDQVALRLNQRPRKTLVFETPASKLQASVASTA